MGQRESVRGLVGDNFFMNVSKKKCMNVMYKSLIVFAYFFYHVLSLVYQHARKVLCLVMHTDV